MGARQAKRILGIDPGVSGGACLLDRDGRTAVAVWQWALAQDQVRGGQVRLQQAIASPHSAGPTVHYFDHHASVGEHLANKLRGHRFALYVEDQYVPTQRDQETGGAYRGRLALLLRLSRMTGYLTGPLVSIAANSSLVQASTWRRDVLGLGRETTSQAAEAASRAALLRTHPEVAGVPELINPTVHLAEAAMVARCGALLERGGPLFAGG